MAVNRFAMERERSYVVISNFAFAVVSAWGVTVPYVPYRLPSSGVVDEIGEDVVIQGCVNLLSSRSGYIG
jgi:hypothetical protein